MIATLSIGGAVATEIDTAQDASASVFGATPVSVESLSRDFQSPAELTFSVPGDWRGTPYAPDSAVTLAIDGEPVFSGRLDLPSAEAQVGQGARVHYRAVDDAFIAATRPALSTDGWTQFRLSAGRLDDVVESLLTHVQNALEAVGIAGAVEYVGGAEGVATLPVTLRDETLDSCMRKVAAAAPGVRVLVGLDGATPVYRFVRAFGAPALDVDLAAYRVEQIQIDRTVFGRAGAVRTNQRQVSGNNTAWQTLSLSPAWDPVEEASWTIDRWLETNSDGNESDASLVFRRWSYSGTVPDDAELKVQVVELAFASPLRRDFAVVAHDADARTVTTAVPLIRPIAPHKNARYNVKISGAVAPTTVVLRYRPGGGGYVTVPGSRWPEAGFAGRAYAAAPVLCGHEKQVTVPVLDGALIAHADYARSAWEVWSEPEVRGRVSIVGEPIAAAMFLGSRINLVDSIRGETGYESLAAPLMAIHYEFGPQRLLLGFDADRSVQLIGGGSG